MIVTFYSYKPEAGCTMAAVNVGTIFSMEMSKRVLIVDCNFEQPKIRSYLKGMQYTPVSGILDFVGDFDGLLRANDPIEKIPEPMDYITRIENLNLYYMLAAKNKALFDLGVGGAQI
jgi:cellulose biosynthesis protein BcsQ